MRLKEQIDQELKTWYPSERILTEILERKTPGRIPAYRILLCAALGVCLLAFPVSAHMFGTLLETTRITDENRALLNEQDIAVAEECPAEAEQPETPKPLMDDPEKVSEMTGGIIQHIDDGAFLPDTVSVIRLYSDETDGSWTIPELLTANGFTTIFADADGNGWYLQKGETLTLHCQIGRTAGTEAADPAERMEIGYIRDHVFYQGELFREIGFDYTLTAPETGTYYPYCINSTDGRIYIRGGFVNRP